MRDLQPDGDDVDRLRAVLGAAFDTQSEDIDSAMVRLMLELARIEADHRSK